MPCHAMLPAAYITEVNPHTQLVQALSAARHTYALAAGWQRRLTQWASRQPNPEFTVPWGAAAQPCSPALHGHTLGTGLLGPTATAAAMGQAPAR